MSEGGGDPAAAALQALKLIQPPDPTAQRAVGV